MDSSVPNLYDDAFMASRRSRHGKWQATSASILARHFNCESVVDFGCGTGCFLEGFHKVGVKSLKGLEVDDEAARRHSDLSVRDFIFHGDLRAPIVLDRSYDLALCVEVLEHIPVEHAQGAVRNIARASNSLFISAARPGQRGVGHVNCQTKDYWLCLFAQCGYYHCVSETRQIALELRESGAASWIINNGMVIRNAHRSFPIHIQNSDNQSLLL